MKPLPSSMQRTSFDLVRDLGRSLRLFQEGAVICYDITFTQFVILDFAHQRQPLRLGDLHQLLAVEKSTTSRLIKPLLEKGLLEKKQDQDDGRSYELLLTSKGGEVHTIVWNCFADAIGRFFSAIPEEEQSHVSTALQIINRAFLTCCDREDCCR